MATKYRYRNPVPGGTIGRTDQGVDISGSPGTPVYAIADETLVGIQSNWYQGQPFYLFKQAGSNIYNYVAEQFTSGLRIGQSVKAGDQIGSIASSGTGLELGWATPSGETLAHATTGYTEGIPTPAGTSYKQQVITGGTMKRGGQFSGLAKLWINNGGSPQVANLMAAIAMAESSGQINATNQDSNGTTDYGLWQINSSHGYDPQRLLSDRNYNARAAVAVYKSQGLGAWTTYTSGAYKPFLYGTGASAGSGGRVRPGGETSNGGGSSAVDISTQFRALEDQQRSAPPSTFVSLKNFSWNKALGGDIGSNSIVGDILSPFRWWNQQLDSSWNNLEKSVTGPADALIGGVNAVDSAASETVKILQNFDSYLLRFTEFVTGLLLMGLGMFFLSRPRGSGAGIVSSFVAATPLGEYGRIRRATRLGRREGQAEHYRLRARRQARETEAAKNASGNT